MKDSFLWPDFRFKQAVPDLVLLEGVLAVENALQDVRLGKVILLGVFFEHVHLQAKVGEG